MFLPQHPQNCDYLSTSPCPNSCRLGDWTAHVSLLKASEIESVVGWSSKASQWEKVLTAKHDDPSSVLGTHGGARPGLSYVHRMQCCTARWVKPVLERKAKAQQWELCKVCRAVVAVTPESS